ncbi:hypothetical protein HYR65_00190, partial [Candidatus Azambacteria bacterium]|nr:hypothetical protein [Candidatus Azambacteria bacterium]
SGSDREASPTTELLKKKGINVFLEQKTENVPTDADVVVYSDAVWDDNPERIRVKELGLREISYFEALGEASKGKYTIAVTGTHGKTTVTAMLAKILVDAGKKPTAIVGSFVSEFGSNFIQGSEDLFVVEGCEYRDHVLKLSPTILVLTNVEWDHTDWFPTLEAEQEMFGKAAAALPKEGALVTNVHSANVKPIAARAKCRVVDYTKENVPELQLVGEFNKMNARAAKAAAKALYPYMGTVLEAGIDRSLALFTGTWRRFEYKGKTKEGALVYDDYAHHPTAIKETLKAVRAKFPDKKLVVAFHPHLYSRTRDLMEGFAGAFAQANEVLVAPIYPARENPILGVTAEALAEQITLQGIPASGYKTLQEVEARLRKIVSPNVVIFTMGAGDVYKVADSIVSSVYYSYATALRADNRTGEFQNHLAKAVVLSDEYTKEKQDTLTADECDVRQSILRVAGRSGDAAVVIEDGLQKNRSDGTLHTEALLLTGKAEVLAEKQKNAEEVQEIIKRIETLVISVEKENKLQAIRVYRGLARFYKRSGNIAKLDRAVAKARQLIQETGAKDQEAKLEYDLLDAKT